MTAPLSVTRRLTRGMSWIGLFGGLSLIVFVSFDVEVMLEQRSAEEGWRGEWLEIAEHVVLPLIVLMMPMFIAGRWVIRTSLAPLGIAAAHIDAAAGTDRGFRLNVDDLPVETQHFAHAINNLLRRLDDAAGQREAFAANAAHELRTPLAILMAELDRLESPDAARLKKDVAAMNRLVGQIMMIAQVEAHVAAPIARDRVSLEQAVMDVINRYAPIAAAQGKHIELRVESRPVVRGIRETIVAAVSNLVDNGLRVTPVGGNVVVTVGPAAQIGVHDGGCGLSPTELAILSQRFARGDHASASGAGLGLAIVARIMEIHRGELATNPHRQEIRLSFPELDDMDQ